VFSAQAVTYVYDNMNRLTEVHFDDSTWLQYTYDDVGNQTGKTYYNEFFSITVNSGAGGTISPSSANVIYGGSQTFTITPDTGHSIAVVSVDGAGQGAITSYTFSNVSANHAISASFTINTYTVTPSAGTGGSISPLLPPPVNYGGTISFTVTANTGYGINSVTGCGGTLSGNIYTTGQITANCSVTASFAADTYTVTPSAGTGGSISPLLPPPFHYGDTPSFTVTPNTGYGINSVTGCGGTLSGNIFTTGPITADCSVSATFTNYPIINSRTNAGYTSIQTAYNAALNGDTILAQNLQLTEDFTAGQNISVTIDGGYNSDYSANPDKTTLQGAATVSAGTVTWKNFEISK